MTDRSAVRPTLDLLIRKAVCPGNVDGYSMLVRLEEAGRNRLVEALGAVVTTTPQELRG